MLSSTLRVSSTRKVFSGILLATILLLGACLLSAQESVLVSARFSKLSVYDLGLQNLSEAIDGSYVTEGVVVDPNNPRLAYVGAAFYISVFDLTIGREINRITVANGLGYMALSADGKYLLLADNNTSTLDIIDIVRQAVVRKVNLLPSMGAGAINGNLGSVVAVGTKAYVATIFTDQGRPAVAVVDLRSYQVKSAYLPSAGYFDTCVSFGACYTSPNMAATPDGKYVALAQTNNDGTFHLFFVSTANNQVVLDVPQTFDPTGLAITPVNQPGSIYGYMVGRNVNDGSNVAIVLDLNNPQSPNFGKQVQGTTPVSLQAYFGTPSAIAINTEGTKVFVGGFKGWKNSPNPNLIRLDTAAMRNNPGGALDAHTTAAGGVWVFGLTVAPTFSPAPSPPTVSSVSGPIVNNQPNTITVTGTNFAPGAFVRIGTQPPLPATGNSTSLQVTVPQNAPAQANLDVIVVNPNINGPRNQQYQSGVKTAALSIEPNPAFLPQYNFASLHVGGYGVSVFDPVHGTMIDNHTGPIARGITFSTDGSLIWGSSSGNRGQVFTPEAVPWNLQDVQGSPVALQGQLSGLTNLVGAGAIAASVNPSTGTAVVFAPVILHPGSNFDVGVEMVDTNTNQASTPIAAGLTSNDVYLCCAAATPDGRYVYVAYILNYFQGSDQVYGLTVFDVLNGTANNLTLDGLGIGQNQSQLYVTPDGQSLLAGGYSIHASTVPIAVLDIGKNPMSPALVTNLKGTSPNFSEFYFYNYQVVGNRLFALDGNQGIVVAFNFDRSTGNFTQLGTYAAGYWAGALAASPDGALVFVSDTSRDLISVLDAAKLASNMPSLITNIGAFPAAYQVAVSPALMNPAQLQVTTNSVPNGTQGVAYSAQLAGTGGVPPYKWTVTIGTLPPGLALAFNGKITGVPTTAGISNFTVQLTDGLTHTATKPLSITIQTGSPLHITTVSLPVAPINQPYYVAMSATGGTPPYTWSNPGGNMPTGLTLSTAGVISGTPTVLQTKSFTVQVKDSASPQQMFSAPFSITVNTSGNAGLLSGHYAFAINGFDQQPESFTLAGSFVADGNGNITGGVADYNGVVHGPSNTTFTGTYQVGANSLGTATVNIVGVGTQTFAFSLSDAAGNGRIIQYQNGAGWGSGPLRRQDPNAFSLSSLAGTYVFGGSGADHQGYYYVNAGEVTIDAAGNMSNGIGDDADAGGYSSSFTFSGIVSSPNPSSGRASAQLSTDKGPSNLAIYVVSATELLMTGTDNVQQVGDTIAVMRVLRQANPGTYSNSSLYGNAVFYGQAAHSPNGGGGSKAEAGLATADGNGVVSVVSDENSSGTLKYSSGYARYSVASNGRLVISDSGGQTIFYLADRNLGFYVNDDIYKAEGGFLEPQSGGPFSNASINGSYAGGTLPPVLSSIGAEVDSGLTDGAGNYVGSYYSYDGGGINFGTGDVQQLNVGANGRGTAGDGSIIYVVSPSKWVAVFNDQDPKIGTFEAPSALRIVTASLPNGTQGVYYTAALTAAGGAFPYTWLLTSGSLPAGLTLSPDGVISGIPSSYGASNFTALVTDSAMKTASASLSITIQQGSLLQITTSSFPNAPVNQPYYVGLTVSGGVPPYTWSIVQGSLPTGLSLSGAAVTGTPTTQGTATFTVQVTDSASPAGHGSKQFSITVNTYGNPGLLNGHYAMAMNGFDHVPDEFTTVGSFVADGNGNINNGVVDFNAITQGPIHSTFTGTYAIGSGNTGTMTITVSGVGSMTLAFALSSSGNGRIIQYQSGQGWGSGVLRKQDTGAFSLSSVAGTYVWGNPGFDWQGNRQVVAGLTIIDSAGNVSGSGDAAGNGQSKSISFTGTMSAVDVNTGRTTALLNSDGVVHFAYYVVSATEILGTSTDNAQQTHNSVGYLQALRQANPGHYSNASLNGTMVGYSQAIEPPSMGGGPQAKLLLLTADGNGNIVGIGDSDDDGTLTQESENGTYSIASNGRGQFGDSNIIYLAGQNSGFVVGAAPKNKAELGFVQPQTGGPFSNASFSGSYYGGTLDPVQSATRTQVGVGIADGAGNAVGNFFWADEGYQASIGIDFGGVNPYNLAANGRGVFQSGDIIYAISPGKVAILCDCKGPKIELYEQ